MIQGSKGGDRQGDRQHHVDNGPHSQCPSKGLSALVNLTGHQLSRLGLNK